MGSKATAPQSQPQGMRTCALQEVSFKGVARYDRCLKILTTPSLGVVVCRKWDFFRHSAGSRFEVEIVCKGFSVWNSQDMLKNRVELFHLAKNPVGPFLGPDHALKGAPVGQKRVFCCGLGTSRGMNLKLCQNVRIYDPKIWPKFQAGDVSSFGSRPPCPKPKKFEQALLEGRAVNIFWWNFAQMLGRWTPTSDPIFKFIPHVVPFVCSHTAFSGFLNFGAWPWPHPLIFFLEILWRCLCGDRKEVCKVSET